MPVINLSINVNIPSGINLKAVIDRLDYKIIDPDTKKELNSELVGLDIIDTGLGKVYNIMHNVGTAKYVINTHDGIQTHSDGSPFFGISCHSNKKTFNRKLALLIKEGYKEQGFSIA